MIKLNRNIMKVDLCLDDGHFITVFIIGRACGLTFKDVEEFISDSKAIIQQFANYLEAVNNKIKTSLLDKRYLTDDGKSLGSVNEMMTEVSSMIQTTREVVTRHIQIFYFLRSRLSIHSREKK